MSDAFKVRAEMTLPRALRDALTRLLSSSLAPEIIKSLCCMMDLI